MREVITLARTITEDTTIFGPKMKKGQMIVTWISAANLDENKFPQADRFDLHRFGNEKTFNIWQRTTLLFRGTTRSFRS